MKFCGQLQVYYVDDGIKGFKAACASFHRSWDGTVYAETNCRFPGNKEKLLYLTDDGFPGFYHEGKIVWMNGGLPQSQVALINRWVESAYLQSA